MMSARKNKRINSIIITTSADSKKFTRDELEEACRKLTATRSNSSTVTVRGKENIGDKSSKEKRSNALSQIQALDTGVKLCARKYNESKATADRMEQEYGKRLDELSELQRESSVLRNMIQGNNPEAKKIARLTEDIEVSNRISETKLNYRHKLNFIHQRQRKNGIVVDAHMAAMSTALSGAERERQKCKKLLGEVESALASALHEFDCIAREVELERAQRESAMAAKKSEANNAESLESWRIERESKRLDFEKSLGGTYDVEKEEKNNIILEKKNELTSLNKKLESKSSAYASSEEAFTHIKRATGVNTLAEMVEKFTNHQEHCNRLRIERKEAEERLNEAKKSLERSLNHFANLKTNGFGDTELNREIMNDAKEQIDAEKMKGKVIKSTNIRLETVLVGLRQGGMGLYQRLLPFHPTLLDGDAPTLNESDTASAIQAAHDTLEMLLVSQQILRKMLDSIGGVEKVRPRSANGEIIKESKIKENIESLENPNLGENNCRIQAKVCVTHSPWIS